MKGQCFFSEDTAIAIKNRLANGEIHARLRPILLPDLAPDVFFLFKRMKEKLVGLP